MPVQDAAKHLTVHATIEAARCCRRPKLLQRCLGRGYMRSRQCHRRGAQLGVRSRSLLRMTALMPLQLAPGAEMLCGAAELLAQASLPQCLCVHCTRHAHRGPQRCANDAGYAPHCFADGAGTSCVAVLVFASLQGDGFYATHWCLSGSRFDATADTADIEIRTDRSSRSCHKYSGLLIRNDMNQSERIHRRRDCKGCSLLRIYRVLYG